MLNQGTLDSENVGGTAKEYQVWRAIITDDNGNIVASSSDGIRYIAEREAVLLAESIGYTIKQDKGSTAFISCGLHGDKCSANKRIKELV